ncbi:hypothetical protein SAMN04487897_101205 [Paenibacillus sp. yr247]|nr:hypothetical protein SAMN04487897_101205 [Paenibacillus sp. yr247]
MHELVGHCQKCLKQIFCHNGFLNGTVLEDKSLVCFDCSDQEHVHKSK